jgi:hypothetical protein
MTVAAGFPIASLIPGPQKTPGKLAAPSAPTPAGSAIISFRAGFEQLVTSAQQSASESASSERIKSQLTEDTSADSQSTATRDLLNQSSFDSSPASAQTPQATALSRAVQSSATASAASQASLANSQPVILPASIVDSSTTPASKSKPAGSEPDRETKQSATAQHSTKAAAPAAHSSNETPAPAAVHIPNPSQAAAAPASLPSQAIHSTLSADSHATTSALIPTAFALPASSSAPKAPTAASSISVATSAAQQAKAAPVVPVTDESHLSSAAADAASSAISTATEAPAAHSSAATSAEAAAQPASPRTSTPTPPSADGSTSQASLNSASAQSTSGNVDNPLQPAIGDPQAVASSLSQNSSSSRGPAPRERGPGQREAASNITAQVTATGSQSTLVRDPSGQTGINAERTGGAAQSTQTSSAVPTTRDTFAALDADPGQPATTWTHTAPRQVEAGYQDPALGWVSVRADLTAGGLHASVVPNSSEAAQALGNHISALNSYLAEHHGGSITATLSAPEDRTSTLAHNNQSGSESGARQQNEASQTAPQSVTAQASASSAIETDAAQHAEPALFTPTHNGRISVLA